jgi:YegS/Rv2252/BmrU family lipid kinase
MRYLLIVNPTSGGGRNRHLLGRVLKYFRRKGDDVEVAKTSASGDAARAALSAIGQDWDAVVAAGGDGTIHEVVGALAGTALPLGILPWGTGNVFAKEMGLPSGVKGQCRVIRKGRTLVVDLGTLDGRPFLLMASVGFDAYVLGRMRGLGSKRIWGVAAYAWAALGALARYGHRPVDVVLDGGRRDRGSFVLVSNTSLYGAFFVIQPQADPTDGALDVFVFRDAGRWKFLGMAAQLVWHSLTGSHGSLGLMRRHGVYRAREVDLVPGHGLPVQVDGEFLPEGGTAVGVIPRALRVLLPKRTLKRFRLSAAGRG